MPVAVDRHRDARVPELVLDVTDRLAGLETLIEALAPQLQAQAPVLQRVVEEAQASASGDDDRLAALLRERNDPRENPRLAAKVGQEVRHGLIRVLLAAIREEKARGR